MTETDLIRITIKALKSVGYWPIRINSGSAKIKRGYLHLAPKGTPDICLVYPCGWLEAKLPGEKCSPDQTAWHARARAHGVRVGVFTTDAEALEYARKWARS